MTPLDKCIMIAYRCDYKGSPYDGYPVWVDLRDVREFLVSEAAIHNFFLSGYLMQPQDWPAPDYPECLCGLPVEGDDHFLLQLGADDLTVGEEDWAEWEIGLHLHCMPGFFEVLTGGRFIGDREEEVAYRDDPVPVDIWTEGDYVG